jgi:hypothetical protein
MKIMTIAYLACPYSDPDLKVKEMRHALANEIAAELLSQGTLVFSPLTYSIPLSHSHKGWANWRNFDLEMLSRCDRLIVLKLPGWESSNGVAEEITHAKELGLPIEWMEVPEEKIQKRYTDAKVSTSLVD